MVLGCFKYGAVAANLSSIALISVAIPILSLLPRSVARAPRRTKSGRSEQLKPTQQHIELQQLIPRSISDSVREATSEEDAAYTDREDHIEHQEPHRKGFLITIREADYAGAVRNYTHLPTHNPLCFMFLAIMFVNSLAMGIRAQVKTWISTRYGWPLADVGYILSVESVVSVVGVAVLFTLPWLGRVQRRPIPSSHAAAVEETAAESRIRDGGSEDQDPAGAVKRRRELWVARASLGFGAAGALIIALAANRAVFVLGLVVMTGAVGFPDAVRAYHTSFFAGDEIQALYAAATVVEMLGVILGSPDLPGKMLGC